MQPDMNTYHYGSLQQALDLLKAKNIKFVGICQPGCDPLQMQFLVCGVTGWLGLNFLGCRQGICTPVVCGVMHTVQKWLWQ